jgi:hypothetical protein
MELLDANPEPEIATLSPTWPLDGVSEIEPALTVTALVGAEVAVHEWNTAVIVYV